MSLRNTQPRTRWQLPPVAGLAAALLIVLRFSALAATRYVARHGSDTNDGSMGSPWLTIQYAVTNPAVQSGDTILVGEGTYAETVIFTTTVHRITLKGGHDTNDWSWAPGEHPSRIQSGGSGNIILGPPSGGSTCSTNCTIMGFTLSGGQYGVYQPYTPTAFSLLTISHCIITNHSFQGVRIDGDRGYLDIRNCLVAGSGIGIYHVGTANRTNFIYHCTVVSNKRANIWFGNNNCGDVIIRNTISAYAWGAGGSGQEGYGIKTPSPFSQTARISHSLSYGSLTNILGSGIILETAVLTNQPPLFTAMSANDFTLTKPSPCVNSGTNIAGITTDVLLRQRPVGPRADMGAYESPFGGSGTVIMIH